MHKIMLKIFDLTRQFLDLMKLLVVFCIMLFLLFWIQHLIGSNWTWLDFITPYFDLMLKFCGNITDASFHLFKALFEVKYFMVLAFLTLVAVFLKYTVEFVNEMERIYKNTRISVKKINENAFNKALYKEQEREEKDLNNYFVIIYTKLKKRGSQGTTIEEQNELMNDFIKSKTGTEFVQFEHGFMYQFKNFEKIDETLKVLFKVLKSSAPMEYAMCIQIEKDLRKMNKLVELKQFGKITIAADTAYRYSFNKTQAYETATVGIFQHNGGTMEIHEFKEVL